MTKKQKVPVIMRALTQRLNRALKQKHQMLKTAKGERLRQRRSCEVVRCCKRHDQASAVSGLDTTTGSSSVATTPDAGLCASNSRAPVS